MEADFLQGLMPPGVVLADLLETDHGLVGFPAKQCFDEIVGLERT
jgi:hypothetical protein